MSLFLLGGGTEAQWQTPFHAGHTGPGVNRGLWTEPKPIVKRPQKLLIDLTGLDPNSGAENQSWSSHIAFSSPAEVLYEYVCVCVFCNW